MKRAKDNSGIGYSYGTAIATLANQKINSSNNYKLYKSKEHHALPQPMAVQPKEELHNTESLMKTTIINNDPLDDEVILGMVSVCSICYTCVSCFVFYICREGFNLIAHKLVISNQ